MPLLRLLPQADNHLVITGAGLSDRPALALEWLNIMDVISKEKAPPQSPPRRPALHIGDLFKPHAAIPRRIYLGTVFFSLALIFIIWSVLTYGGFIHPS